METNLNLNNLMGIKEVAEKLDISNSTVKKLIVSGELKAIKVGSQYKIPESSFTAFIEKASS